MAWFATAPILKLIHNKSDFASIKEKENVVPFIKSAAAAVIIAAIYFV